MSVINPKPKHFRAFFAIDLPQEIKTSIGQLITTMQQRGGWKNCRWIKPKKLHITLRFLGNISQQDQDCLVPKINNALKTITPFQIELATLEVFPSPKKPHILSIKPTPISYLTHIAQLIDHEVISCGLPRDNRPFLSHLTLAKFDSHPCPNLPQIKLPALKFMAKNVILFQSKNDGKNSNYIPLDTFALSKSGPKK